jgi:uncharacterized membrane protein YecN with MAPEG domain
LNCFLLFAARKVHKSEMIQSENRGPDRRSGNVALAVVLGSTMLLLLLYV